MLGRLLTRVEPGEVATSQHLPLFMLAQTVIHELLLCYQDVEDRTKYTNQCLESVREALEVNQQLEARLRDEHGRRKDLAKEKWVSPGEGSAACGSRLASELRAQRSARPSSAAGAHA